MFSFKSILAVTLFSLVTFTIATGKPIAPVVEYAFSVFINLKASLLADGPYGERVNCGYNNGTITDKTGKQIGTVLPGVGSENAIVDEQGVVHLNARVTATMASDSATGYMVMEGNSTSFPLMNKETYVYTLRRSTSLNTSQIDVFKASYPGVPS
ncbi:hypothetical protein BDQ17DRAFT_1426334 [Cyathus striatus]|nr:hypothetical protein BDQ17DRAFT_1426334 [Cyathus striatus]